MSHGVWCSLGVCRHGVIYSLRPEFGITVDRGQEIGEVRIAFKCIDIIFLSKPTFDIIKSYTYTKYESYYRTSSSQQHEIPTP